MSWSQIYFLRGSLTAQDEHVHLADYEAKRARDETQQFREKSWALRREIKSMADGIPGFSRWKQNRHGGSSWADPSEEFDPGRELGEYHDGYDSY